MAGGQASRAILHVHSVSVIKGKKMNTKDRQEKLAERWDSLPSYVRDEIQFLRRTVEDLKTKLDTIYEPATDESRVVLNPYSEYSRDIGENSSVMFAIGEYGPRRRTKITVSIERRYDGRPFALSINASDTIAVSPIASNCVRVIPVER